MRRLCAAFVAICLAAGLVVAATARDRSPSREHRAIGRLLVDQVMIIRQRFLEHYIERGSCASRIAAVPFHFQP